MRWFILAGFVLVALTVAAGLTAPPITFIVATLAAALVASGIYQYVRRRALLREFRQRYVANGQDLLLVYSDSPHWKPYIEARWLPRWGQRAVLFNRSRPWSEGQLEVRLWRAEAGNLEHTPVAIVVAASGSPTIVRFWRAFRDYKHGKERRLREAERRLELALGEDHDRDG